MKSLASLAILLWAVLVMGFVGATGARAQALPTSSPPAMVQQPAANPVVMVRTPSLRNSVISPFLATNPILFVGPVFDPFFHPFFDPFFFVNFD
jgi:hypothetical protein